MSIAVKSPPDVEQRIKENASKDRQAVEDYVRTILIRNSNGAAEAVASREPLTAEEFERLLGELSEPVSLPVLHADMNR
jgi:hypothetical protein